MTIHIMIYEREYIIKNIFNNNIFNEKKINKSIAQKVNSIWIYIKSYQVNNRSMLMLIFYFKTLLSDTIFTLAFYLGF